MPIEVEVEGEPVTKLLPFDKGRIFPYAYRHSFAQRHADKGVKPEVLKDLMDHRQLQTSQAYYRIGRDRRREAIDRVAVMQFDRHGNRVWRQVQGSWTPSTYGARSARSPRRTACAGNRRTWRRSGKPTVS
ncbi:hypothetical protein AR457_37900 [Streptomyces agglomeratus]|uniref:hypothetical protein n=1 Tax=Streptomyces agglomeratus TaxID=285458 RepID=UPI000854094D|nr:hypothetical protein [Streptomyces agglomeratus]OEJ22981.1 hypothetical protein AR457_37900 [Streptomyces agglomeratus]